MADRGKDDFRNQLCRCIDLQNIKTGKNLDHVGSPLTCEKRDVQNNPLGYTHSDTGLLIPILKVLPSTITCDFSLLSLYVQDTNECLFYF